MEGEEFSLRGSWAEESLQVLKDSGHRHLGAPAGLAETLGVSSILYSVLTTKLFRAPEPKPLPSHER